MSQLISTYKQLSKIFSSVSSFEKNCLRRMKDTSPFQWGQEIKGQLYQIRNFLLGRLTEKESPSSETVILWIDNIKSLYRGAKAINYNINNAFERCEIYCDMPEGYYPDQMVEDELKRTGKSYEELHKEIKTDIIKNYKRYKELLPYSKKGEAVLSFVVSKLEETFKSVLKDTNEFKREINIQKKDDGKEKNRSLINHTVKPFECPQNQKLLISKICDRLISNGYITSPKNEFVLIFDSEPSSIKINWTKKLNHLHYFIDKLCSYLKIDKTNHWLITETYFLVKERPIKSKSLQHANKIGNASKRKIDLLF